MPSSAPRDMSSSVEAVAIRTGPWVSLLIARTTSDGNRADTGGEGRTYRCPAQRSSAATRSENAEAACFLRPTREAKRKVAAETALQKNVAVTAARAPLNVKS